MSFSEDKKTLKDSHTTNETPTVLSATVKNGEHLLKYFVICVVC